MNTIILTPYSILIPLENTVAITIADSLVMTEDIIIINNCKSYRPKNVETILKVLIKIAENYKIITGKTLEVF